MQQRRHKASIASGLWAVSILVNSAHDPEPASSQELPWVGAVLTSKEQAIEATRPRGSRSAGHLHRNPVTDVDAMSARRRWTRSYELYDILKEGRRQDRPVLETDVFPAAGKIKGKLVQDLIQEVQYQPAACFNHILQHFRFVIIGIAQAFKGQQIADAADHRTTVDAQRICPLSIRAMDRL